MSERGREGRTSASAAADEGVRELYAASWAPLVRLAWLLTRNQSQAEDIVQDALVATHRSWERLRDPDAAAAYLRRAVVNGARSAGRHAAVVERHLSTVAEASVEGPETLVVADEVRGDLVAALRRLPRRQREVLVLRYYLDLGEREIADALGISTGSVKSHAHRGIAALATEFTGGEPR